MLIHCNSVIIAVAENRTFVPFHNETAVEGSQGQLLNERIVQTPSIFQKQLNAQRMLS